MPVFKNNVYNVQLYINIACIPYIGNNGLKKDIAERELLTVVGKKGLNLNFFKHIEQV